MTARKTFRIAIRKFGPFESAIEKQWHSFDSAAHCGLTLEAVAFDLRPLSEALFDRQGMLRGDWDIAFLDTDWLAHAHATKAALNLAPYLKMDPPHDFPNGWSDSLLRLQTIEGEVLGLPYHDGPECLIYRKDLFEDPREQRAYEARFGSALRVPQTWIEFRQVAAFFQRPQENLFGTAFAAYPDGHNSVYDFLLQLWTRGGEIVDSGGQFQVESPAAIEALEFYRDILQDASVVHPRCAEMDSVKCGLAFVNGEIAMMVNWFGFAAMAETVANSRVRGNVDIANIPRAEGCESCSLNVYWVLAIGAGSPHREAAYQFLRHAATAEMDKLLTLEGAVGCRKSTWRDPEVNRMVPFYKRLDDLHVHARELPRLAEWPEVASVIDRMIVKLIGTREPAKKIAGEAQRELNLASSSRPPAR
ncbi:MAG: extracellular solute-binding protein [Candidatus Acidiferrales bacterium]